MSFHPCACGCVCRLQTMFISFFYVTVFSSVKHQLQEHTQVSLCSLIRGRHRKRKHKHIILIASLPLCEAPLCNTEKTILSPVACREVITHMKVTLCQIWSQHGSVTSPHPSLHLCELRSTQKDALLISLSEAKLRSSIYPASVLWEHPGSLMCWSSSCICCPESVLQT